MEFAKRELEKYGWVEGQGLGKNEDGIVKALKPKLKFDNAGLGHDISEEFNNQWWQKVYDEASRNIVTEKKDNEVIIKTKKTEKRKKKKTEVDLGGQNAKYKGFIKTSNLKGVKEKRLFKSEFDNEPNVSVGNSINDGITNLLDEELLKVCGGRTVHKGARHGLKMSAKLARIEEQEKNLMKSAENFIFTENEISKVNKNKKKKKCKEKKQ